LKENNCQSRLLYPARLSITFEGEIKIFHDKQKLQKFMTTKPELQKIIIGNPYSEEDKHNQKKMGKTKSQ
jgi:hypothetical protein